MTAYTALVLAGARPGPDAFAQSHGTDLKALIPLGGEAMVRRPVAALIGSKRIALVRVLAQEPERIRAVLPPSPRLTVEHSGATVAATLEAICNDPTVAWPVLVTTADHALLDADMIDDFCRRSEGADAAVGVVERQALLARLPASRRTWIKLRGGAYSGANLFLLASPKVVSAIALWRGVEQDRKKGWRLLSAMGPLLSIGAMLRLLTIEQAARRVGGKLGLEIRPVIMANPLAAVDVDKPDDHAMVEALLKGRA